jgi:hypothetical protein
MKLPPAGAVHDQREIDAVVDVLRNGLNADHMGYICEQLDDLFTEIHRRGRT